MRFLLSTIYIFYIFMASLTHAMPPASHVDESQAHISVELITESSSLKPGQPLRIGVKFTPEPHWHIYWSNPGDTGLAPSIEWILPKGLDLDRSPNSLRWPFPESIPVAHLTNYGYENEVLLYTTIIANERIKNIDPLYISAKLSWLVCNETCIPGKSTLSLPLAMHTDLGEVKKNLTPYFDQWEAKTPKAYNLNGAEIDLDLKTKTLSAAFYANDLLFKEAEFVEIFVKNLDLVQYKKAIKIEWDNNWLRWEQNLSEYHTGKPTSLDLVVVIDKKHSYLFTTPF